MKGFVITGLLLGMVVGFTQCRQGQPEKTSSTSKAENGNYAIVIHGGAGNTQPEDLPEAERTRYKKKLEEEAVKRAELEDTKKDIGWGSQIRSYVFHPYNMVKDHRTNHETSNIQNVMDGDLDEFIEDYLMQAQQ